MKNIFNLLFLSLSLLEVQQTYAQNKWELHGQIGTNYGLLNKNSNYQTNQNWYPGLILGGAISYKPISSIGIETGINYELIRIGEFKRTGDSTIIDNGGYGGYYQVVVYETVRSGHSFNYLNLPLSLNISL